MDNKIDKNDKRVQYLMRKDKILAKYIKKKSEIDYFLSNDFNQFFVYTIIGQLISTKVANKIFARFRDLCDNDLSPMTILKFSPDDLRALGMTYKKADYILSFMRLLNENKNYLHDIKNMDDKNAMCELIKLHGVGKWTAKMILMFCFDRQDIVPVEDLAFVKGYNSLYKCKKTPSQILQDCKKWSPYSSVASRYVYEYGDELFGNIPKL